MRRAVFVCLLLVACGSTTKGPDTGERIRRARTVGPALLGATPDLTQLDQVSCSLNDKPAERAHLATLTRRRVDTPENAARQVITIDLITCPTDRWKDLTDSWTTAGVADRATVAKVVLEGVQALQR